jgi:predicted  nucleic acid-binding Zn-ribbon protein
MMPMGGDEDEIDLLELWRILLKGKWIIAGVTLCCVLAGVGYALLATPMYKVKTVLAPGTTGFNGDQLPVKATSISSMKDWFASGVYLPEMIKRFGIEAVENGTIPSGEGQGLELKLLSNMLTVSLKTALPATAKTVLKNIVEVYASKEENYPASKANMEKHIFDLTQKIESWDLKRSRLDDAIVKTIRQRKLLEANLTVLDRHIEDQKAILQRMGKRVDTINGNTQELIELRKTMLEGESDKLSELMYANFVQQNITYASNLEQRMDSLRADLNNQTVSRRKLLDEMENLEMSIADIKERQVRELEQEKRNLEKRLEVAKLQITQLSPVEVIESPFSSVNPVAPKKKLIVALSTVGGLFVGIFAVFFVNFVKNAQRKEEDKAA